MMMPVTMDAATPSTTAGSRSAASELTEILARLGSPASDVDGRPLEREVHEALTRLRTQLQAREQARRAPRPPERA
jgi:hypothetical protein